MRALLSASWILLAIAALGSARAGEPPFTWTLTGCVSQHGDALLFKTCSGDCLQFYWGRAETTVTQAGTLEVALTWSNPGDPGLAWVESITVMQNNDIVFELDDWCPTPTCTGEAVVTLQVAAGDTLFLELSNDWILCSGTTTCKMKLDFTPLTGFVAGFGGVDERLIATADGTGSFDQLGVALAFLGDLDGDGLADLAAGAGNEFGEHVRVVSGASGAKLFDLTQPTPAYDGFGRALAAVGDVDGDGLADLLVGTGDYGDGPASLWSGADGALLHVFLAPQPSGQFADAVAAAGDVDGDGVPDVLISEPWSDAPGAGSGIVRAYSGASWNLLWHVAGAPGDSAGQGLASCGDLDGDGVPDVAIGSPYADVGASNAGVVRVHSGANQSVLRTLTGPVVASTLFGAVVVSGGDFDADGVQDILASSSDVSFAAFGEGHVRGFSSATGALLFELYGETKDYLGLSLACLSDFDGDGHDDALAGSWFGNPYALLVSGATGDVLAKLVIDVPWAPYLGANGTGFGSACASGGDADGDGRADFAVGAPLWAKGSSAPSQVGRVHVFSGDSQDFVPPPLTGTGHLLSGSPITLDLSGGDALAPAFLVGGSTMQPVAFKGGALVPVPELLLTLALDATGSTSLSAAWPAGVPAGTALSVQAWLPDDDGPAGWLASDSLTLATP